MNYPTIALGMIVNGIDSEAPLLARCLASVAGNVDAIYLTLTHKPGEKISQKLRTVAEQYTKEITIYEWDENFAHARNFNLSKIPKKYDFFMWLDADDVVDEPKLIREVAAIVSKNTEGIHVKYDYDHDEYGNVSTSLWTCRMCRHDGSHTWKSSLDDDEFSVHETLQPVRTVRTVANNDFKVIHKSKPERRVDSLQRNINLLEKMYEKHAETGKVDPRILYYLGTHYFEFGNYLEAKNCLQRYLELSGWSQERSDALVWLGQIYTIEGNIEAAKGAYLLATGEWPNNRLPFVRLAEAEFRNKRYQQSLDYCRIAENLPDTSSSFISAPLQDTFHLYMLIAQNLINLGGKHLEEAGEYVSKSLKIRPLDEDAQAAKDSLEKMIAIRDQTKAVVTLAGTIEKDKIVGLLDALPASLQDNPAILNLRHNYTEPKKWPKKSMAIYVGPSAYETWGPTSLSKGLGGSEEAVIHLSRELGKLGWDVTVFATPGAAHGDDYGSEVIYREALSVRDTSRFSVHWRHFWEFNPNDEYDVLISWRAPWFFDNDFKARKQYLWLHDMIEKPELTEERLAKIDKVIFVSQWHADQYADVVPKKKSFASGNGIIPSDFKDQFVTNRKKYRMVYMSAYERGLPILLDIWPEVKKAVPDATLDIYYGWQSFDALLRDNPERQAWKNKLMKQIKDLDGVTEYGKIGQDQIAIEVQRADILAYPSVFPEVYCISYIKACAGGAYPVTSDFAVLGDYNRGTQVHYDVENPEQFKKDYTKALIKELKKSHDRSELINWAQDYSWAHTAESWDRTMGK